MEEKQPHKLSVKIMIAIIALLVLGIILRWDFITGELQDSWQRMFPNGK